MTSRPIQQAPPGREAPAKREATAGRKDARRHRPRGGVALLVLATAQLMVTLDVTIVNVALPRIQQALGFSSSGLEWVVNAYALAFGGGLLIGGRVGDILGRRAMLAAGLLLFSGASLAGGLAGSQAWLLGARAGQGIGAAVAAPAALALTATAFPEGAQRNRALAVYSAIGAVGGAVGLLAGGLLATCVSWRWVFYVNVPLGLVVAAAAPLVLPRAPRQRGRFGLPGAIAATGGLAALVYGLSSAGAADGSADWGTPKVLGSLVAAAVLLAAFAALQRCGRQPLLPPGLLRDRGRSGAYLIMLCAATAMTAVFYFLTLFQEDVWGYSALRTGIDYLPMTAAVLAGASAAAWLVSRTPAWRPLLAGAAAAAAGLCWLSRLSPHGGYADTVLGPTVAIGAGLGLLSVPLSLIALSRVSDSASGAASSLLSTSQQVGGSIGLAVLGTVAWAVASGTARAGPPNAAHVATGTWHSIGSQTRLPTALYDHALASGFARAFLVAAALMLAALIIGAVTSRTASSLPPTPPQRRKPAGEGRAPARQPQRWDRQ
jgi:EmrB/QacA subfamily drug resistance transporter